MKTNTRKQQVLSEPGFTSEEYITKKGFKKKRYFKNPDAKVIKTITHYNFEDVKNQTKSDTVKVSKRTSLEDTLKFLKDNNVDMKKKIKTV